MDLTEMISIKNCQRNFALAEVQDLLVADVGRDLTGGDIFGDS